MNMTINIQQKDQYTIDEINSILDAIALVVNNKMDAFLSSDDNLKENDVYVLTHQAFVDDYPVVIGGMETNKLGADMKVNAQRIINIQSYGGNDAISVEVAKLILGLI